MEVVDNSKTMSQLQYVRSCMCIHRGANTLSIVQNIKLYCLCNAVIYQHLFCKTGAA